MQEVIPVSNQPSAEFAGSRTEPNTFPATFLPISSTGRNTINRQRIDRLFHGAHGHRQLDRGLAP
jgi:hypothetical protein